MNANGADTVIVVQQRNALAIHKSDLARYRLLATIDIRDHANSHTGFNALWIQWVSLLWRTRFIGTGSFQRVGRTHIG